MEPPILPLLDSQLIHIGVECRTRAEAIRRAVELLHAMGRAKEPQALERALSQREAISSTGFGFGFAIPHCKSDFALANSLVLLKLKNPVDWEAIDHQPVDVIILITIREADQPKGHLTILSQLARNLLDETFRQRLAAESDPTVLCTLLESTINPVDPIYPRSAQDASSFRERQPG